MVTSHGGMAQIELTFNSECQYVLRTEKSNLIHKLLYCRKYGNDKM